LILIQQTKRVNKHVQFDKGVLSIRSWAINSKQAQLQGRASASS